MAEFFSQEEIDILLDIAEGVEGCTSSDIDTVISFLNLNDYIITDVPLENQYLKDSVDDFCISLLNKETQIEKLIRLSEVCYILDGILKCNNIDFDEAVKFHRRRGFIKMSIDEWDNVDAIGSVKRVKNHNDLSKSIREVVTKLKEIR